MPLNDLAEYFNNRFEREHHAKYRPLVVENNRVYGVFGLLHIHSVFSPLRETVDPKNVSGYAVKIKVAASEAQYLHSYEMERLALNYGETHIHFESAINFDRLARTVHMLNYLPLAQSDNVLFLEVDPRHILGIKKDHGVYFETVIEQCGLTTKNTVIVLAITHNYVRYSDVLIQGLGNYRKRGYQIAVRFDNLVSDKYVFDLIDKLAPDYVSLSARKIEAENDDDATVFEKLHIIKKNISAIQGQGILRHVDSKKSLKIARYSGFNLVEGNYYERGQAVSNF